MPVQYSTEVDASAALRAFDMLGEDGPRVIRNTMRLLASARKVAAQTNAPGGLKRGWHIEDLTDAGDPDFFGVGLSTPDQLMYEWRRAASRANRGKATQFNGEGLLRVARWTNWGTGDDADHRIKNANPMHPGQKPQRYLRPVSRAEQRREYQEDLLRVARRAGFEIGSNL